MISDLENLIELQEIDLRIREQEMAQEQYPAAVQNFEQEIEKAQATVGSTTSRLQKAEAEERSFEDQIRNAHESLEKSQTRLNSIKTNREYDAVHAEIETHKNLINNAENRRKNLQNEINMLKSAVDESVQDLERIKSENEPKIADLKQKIAAIDSNIQEIEKERVLVTPKITKHALRTYDLIRKKRKTGRVLSVISNSRTCTVCFKVLEPQLYNEVKRGLKLILCQSCGSILVWGEAENNTQQETGK